MHISRSARLAVVMTFAMALSACKGRESSSPQQAVNETAALCELMGIRGQVAAYMTETGKYPETLEALREYLRPPATPAREKGSFRYLYKKTESGWECYAVPASAEAGTLSFYVCEDRVIRVKEGIFDSGGKSWPRKTYAIEGDAAEPANITGK